MVRALRSIIIWALTGLFAAPAVADDEGWHGQLTPYVWATGIGGTITPYTGAPTLSYDASFSEVLKDLDGAFFLNGYARRDRLVVLGDFSHSSSSKEGHLLSGIPASGTFRQTSLTLAGGYRALSAPDVTLDVLAGARLWQIKGAVDVVGGAVSKSTDKNFVDPILALRAHIALAPRWSALFYVDGGGFGVGSHRTSQIYATANYQVNDSLHISAGFRQLKVDYRSAGTQIDATMSGPLIGATWRF